MLRVFTRGRRRTHAFFDYGAHARPRNYLYRKVLCDYVQVIRHNRMRGCPSGGGGAPGNVIVDINRSPVKNEPFQL